MKKHIFGLAVFSFIVGAAAIAYAVFNVPKTIGVADVIPVSVVPQNYSTGGMTSCWNMRRGAKESNFDEPIIKQAVFNLKTKEFSWQLASPNVDLPIALHLFVKDEKGTRYVDGFLAVDSFEWANAPESFANLYVIAERAPQMKFDKKNPPKFDANKAIAVSLDYGK
jgi:hypothetical protein